MSKQFGGRWTEEKLDIVEDYLRSYLRVMKKQAQFSLGYIDAFAGDGSILLASSEDDDPSEVESLVRGSALRALELEPGFDGYIFIEREKQAAERLKALAEDYPSRKVLVRDRDANEELQRICRDYDWSMRRAVVFLDPTGMQVEWGTMESLAATGGIDVWTWFPLGVGVNRLLTRNGVIPSQWQTRLDKIFGTQRWREAFYRQVKENTLFGPEERTEKAVSPEGIARFYSDRLKSAFPAVSSRTRIMRNSRNTPIYLLCFASANAGRGGGIAVKIADHLLSNA